MVVLKCLIPAAQCVPTRRAVVPRQDAADGAKHIVEGPGQVDTAVEDEHRAVDQCEHPNA